MDFAELRMTAYYSIYNLLANAEFPCGVYLQLFDGVFFLGRREVRVDSRLNQQGPAGGQEYTDLQEE